MRLFSFMESGGLGSRAVGAAHRDQSAKRFSALPRIASMWRLDAPPRNDILLLFLLSSFLLFSCASPTQPAQAQTVTAYGTSAAQPWMNDLFACANGQSIIVNVTADDPDVYLRVGEPRNLASPAYQIGEEEILIVTHQESPVQNLTLTEAQALFAGSGGESVQVWVYAAGEDLQGVFDQLTMKGRGVTSFARVASNPQEMSEVLNSESNAVGILPKGWVTGNIRTVFSAGVVPVLAITKAEPQGALKTLVGCLQGN
jgi:hypothetical protein